MNAVDFVRSLYLGDRACKAIAVDCWNSTVRVSVDLISRVRGPSGHWEYYTDEDVRDGVLVFEKVTAFVLKNEGHLPNDIINSIEATAAGEEVQVELSIDSVAGDATHHETRILLRCNSIYIEDPSKPGVRIVQ